MFPYLRVAPTVKICASQMLLVEEVTHSLRHRLRSTSVDNLRHQRHTIVGDGTAADIEISQWLVQLTGNRLSW